MLVLVEAIAVEDDADESISAAEFDLGLLSKNGPPWMDPMRPSDDALPNGGPTLLVRGGRGPRPETADNGCPESGECSDDDIGVYTEGE